MSNKLNFLKIFLPELRKDKSAQNLEFRSNHLYCFGKNPGARGEHLTIQLLQAAAQLLVIHFQTCLTSG